MSTRRQRSLKSIASAVAICLSICIGNAASAADPNLSNQLTSRGYSLLQAGEHTTALKVLTQALVANPGNLPARRLFARANHLSGRHEDCVQQLRAIATIEPDNAGDLVLLGQAYLALGKNGEATDHFKRALKITPDDSSALLGLADINIATGKLQQATALCRRVLATAKNSQARETATQKLTLIEQCNQKQQILPG